MPRWGYGQQMPTEHNGSVKMTSYEEINLNMPIRQNVGSYQTINSDKNSFQNGKYLVNLLWLLAYATEKWIHHLVII